MNQLNLSFLNDPLGVPVGTSNFKCGSEILGVLGLAATAVGLFGSIWASDSANATNRQINRESLDFQEEMLLEQERYNSPVNQRAMLEEAGYSPYAFINGASSSVTGGSSPSSIPHVSPDMSAFDKMAEIMFNMPGMNADVEGKNLDNVGKSYENIQKAADVQYAENNALSNMVRLRNEAEKSGHEMEKAYWDSRLNAFTFDSKVRGFELENQLRQRNIEKLNADTMLVTLERMQAELNYDFLPKLLSADLKLKLAKIDTEYSQRKLNFGEYQQAIKGAFLNENLAKKYGIEASRLERTADAYVEIQGQEAKQAGWRTWTEMYNAQNAYDPTQELLWNNRGTDKTKKYGKFGAVGRGLSNLSPIKLGW